MNPIFRYNGTAKYSTKILKGECIGDDFLVLDVYMNQKGPFLI